MPLVRVEIRNEYGLGMPKLYKEEEDPKALLEGVSVAGLVGILRQLGDLSQFAAEVFHGIQEQVLITSSRSERLGERLYNMEAALPLLEKAILSQRSHLHFAYTSGSQWHARLQTEQNHFIYSDLPLCIMDSYEGCHDPPCLQKLDKFDTNGRGSCFKRYSDPTYFRRASPGPCGTELQSVQREKKAQRSKKKRSLARHRDMIHDAPIFMHDGGGMDSPSRNYTGKTSPSLDGSTIHVRSKSGTEPKEPKMEDDLTCFDSRNGSGFIECIFHPRYSIQSEENETNEMSSDSRDQQSAYLELALFHENNEVSDENVENSSNSQGWSFVTWDEKLEIVESTEILCTEDKLDAKESEELTTSVDLIDFDFHDDRLALSVIPNEIEGEINKYSGLNNEDVDGKLKESNLDDRWTNFESHFPESSYSTTDMSSKQISHESHIKGQRLSNSKSDLSENSDEEVAALTCTDSFISEKPDTNELLSSSSRLYNKSECSIIQSDTSLGPVDSNGLLSSSSRLEYMSECSVIQSDTNLGPVDSNGLLSSSSRLDNMSECSVIPSDTNLGPVDSNEILSSSSRLDNMSECSIIQTDTNLGTVDSNESLSTSSRLDNMSECSIIQSDTNLGPVDSNELLSSSSRLDNMSECRTIPSDTNLGTVDSNEILSSSSRLDNKSECSNIQSDTYLGPVHSNELLSSSSRLDNMSECSIIQSDTNLGSVDSSELSSSSSRLDSSSEKILTNKPLSTSGPHTDPITFWTNGGLLGLAPSKPPDLGAIGTDDLMQKEDIVEDDEKVVKEEDNSLNDSFINASDGPIAKSFNEQFGDGCCFPSPPVEDMRKICLEDKAMDGCKLKLKLCNWHGRSRSGGGVDMFELALNESEVDSDHTFYRSKYASSDECHSESNSEQWDSPTRSINDG